MDSLIMHYGVRPLESYGRLLFASLSHVPPVSLLRFLDPGDTPLTITGFDMIDPVLWRNDENY